MRPARMVFPSVSRSKARHDFFLLLVQICGTFSAAAQKGRSEGNTGSKISIPLPIHEGDFTVFFSFFVNFEECWNMEVAASAYFFFLSSKHIFRSSSEHGQL